MIFLDCNLKKQPCIDLVFLLRPGTEADFVTLALAAFYLKRLSNSTAYILNSVLKVLLFKSGILVNLMMMMMSLKRESPNVSTPKESRGHSTLHPARTEGWRTSSSTSASGFQEKGSLKQCEQAPGSPSTCSGSLWLLGGESHLEMTSGRARQQ